MMDKITSENLEVVGQWSWNVATVPKGCNDQEQQINFIVCADDLEKAIGEAKEVMDPTHDLVFVARGAPSRELFDSLPEAAKSEMADTFNRSIN